MLGKKIVHFDKNKLLTWSLKIYVKNAYWTQIKSEMCEVGGPAA
jgi:hypothetical protein